MIELLVIGATLALAAGAKGAEVHRRSVAARVLARYAKTRDHRFLAAPTSHESPRVEGLIDDVPFTIDLFRSGGQTRTRVRAVASRDRTPLIHIVQRGGLERMVGPSSEGRAIGHPWFDRAYRVSGKDADCAPLLLEDVVKWLMVLDNRDDVWLAATGEHVTLSWARVEDSPIFLDAARDAVKTIASYRRPDAPYR